MGKIFNSDASKGAIYKVGEAKVDIEGAQAVFLSVDITMSRNISPIPTLGSGIQWSAQTPSGTMNVGTILTKSSDIMSKLHAEGDSCKPVSMTISTEDAICTPSGSKGGRTINIKGAYCSQVQFNLTASQGYIGHNLAVMFSEMSITA